MRKFRDILRFTLVLCLINSLGLLASLNTANASEASIRIIRNQLREDTLFLSFEVNPDKVFTPQTLTFLQRGFTIRLDYTVELWRSKNFWFDRLDSQEQLRCELNYDILSRIYKCVISRTDKIELKKSDELSKAIEWVTKIDSLEILDSKKLELKGRYYYNIEADVVTLTAQDIKDLQKWLDNDSDERKGAELSISRTIFNIVIAFLSAKNHRKFSMVSSKWVFVKVSEESSNEL